MMLKSSLYGLRARSAFKLFLLLLQRAYPLMPKICERHKQMTRVKNNPRRELVEYFISFFRLTALCVYRVRDEYHEVISSKEIDSAPCTIKEREGKKKVFTSNRIEFLGKFNLRFCFSHDGTNRKGEEKLREEERSHLPSQKCL